MTALLGGCARCSTEEQDLGDVEESAHGNSGAVARCHGALDRGCVLVVAAQVDAVTQVDRTAQLKGWSRQGQCI